MKEDQARHEQEKKKYEEQLQTLKLQIQEEHELAKKELENGKTMKRKIITLEDDRTKLLKSQELVDQTTSAYHSDKRALKQTLDRFTEQKTELEQEV